MALTILPCPFCGSHHLHIAHHHLTQTVTCETCKSQGPHCRRVEEAILEWNMASKQRQQALLMKEHFLQGHLTSAKRSAHIGNKNKLVENGEI